jgi:hypothetical protein
MNQHRRVFYGEEIRQFIIFITVNLKEAQTQCDEYEILLYLVYPPTNQVQVCTVSR